ncbi:MAG: bifunctional metallophosphatase/5'-nucleotidase [Archangium gephyra]|uniref:Bifunctional metallophosphatase/5'-nucleotidase n=1 Tax=Archangium gephyra TaxID=48 RepID=A0A2W5TSS9_9BACT|nr:MAG: bifunctional metallophosphatase/5'-nucleotidase [Archangium gephyra]
MKRFVIALCALLLNCQTTREAEHPAVPAPLDNNGQPATLAKSNQAIRITVVGTNDIHGWVNSRTEAFPRGEIRYGGLATFAAYVNALRAENLGGVVLLDAGDIFQGTLVSNLTEGAVVIEAFNQLGYDAAAIGNHEFDYGPVGPISAATQATMDPFGALKARIAQSKFPLLSTNIYEAANGARPAWLPSDGTVMIERHGLKIGIVGLTTPQTPTVTLPINVQSLKFRPLGSEALAAATRLREKGADLVFAVVHAGGRCEDGSHHEDLSSCDLDAGEIFEMMKGLPEGTLDAVVAGHTHARVAHFVKGTPIIESWALGRYFGTVELFIDPATRKVIPQRTLINAAVEICETWDVETRSCDPKKLKARADQVTPVQAKYRGFTIRPDQTVVQAMQPAQQAVVELQQKQLGLTVPATLGRAYEAESELGDFLADSLRALAKTDIALLNPGGLRADLHAGPLTYGAVYEVIPFDNAVATLDVTGEQLERLLTAAYGSKKGVFQVSGLDVKLSRCVVPDRLRGFTLPGGKKIDPSRRYRVAMPDFLARGGDGLAPVLATIDPSQVDLADNKGSNVRDDLINHWQAKKEVFKAPKPGRITFVDNGETCAASNVADPSLKMP